MGLGVCFRNRQFKWGRFLFNIGVGGDGGLFSIETINGRRVVEGSSVGEGGRGGG